MILKLFRRRSKKIEDEIGGKVELGKTSNSNDGVTPANSITTPHNAENIVSKTVVSAEHVKVLANPSQLLKLIRKSPILYVGYVRDDDELKSVVEKCGNKLLLLSIRSSGSLTHVIYFDGSSTR